MEEPSNDNAATPNISVVLLAGLPASGKSTLARKLRERLNSDNDPSTDDNSIQKLIHIEYDDLEDSLLSSFDLGQDSRNDNDERIENRQREAWNEARQRAMEQMENEIQKIAVQSSNETIVLMDDNFHLRGMRKQIHRKLLNFRPIRFGILYLKVPLEVCLERNHQRSGRRKIPSDVIERMGASFEPPRVAWEVSSTMTIVDADINSGERFEEIVKFVKNCPEIIDLPTDEIDLEQQAVDRAKTRENEIHGLDKLLRTCVGKVARFDKTLAKNANGARKTVMEDFKAGRVEAEGIIEAFLESIVPASSLNSIIRSNLREILEK